MNQYNQSAKVDVEKRYDQFKLQMAKNNTELGLMKNSKITKKSKKQTGSKNTRNSAKKVTFNDDIEIIPSITNTGIVNTLTNTASMAVSSTVDVIIIIGIYQILSMDSIEKIYGTPLKKYFYTDEEMKNKSYMSYGIKFIMTIILYILIKLLVFG